MTHAAFLLLIILLCACDHKELEEWDTEQATHALVRVATDWSGFTEDDNITGMTVRAYNQETGQITEVLSNNLKYVDLALEPGFYTILVFNQTIGEYSSIDFRDMYDVKSASICAVQQEASRWYSRAEGEFVAKQPAWFARAVATDVEITQQMLEESPYYTRTHTKTKTRQSLNGETAIVVATLAPKNVIHELEVTITIENFKYLRSVRGSIENLAGDVNLFTAQSGYSHVVMLLEKWQMNERRSTESVGQVSTKIRCFGLPADHTGDPNDNLMHLELLLADGATILTYDFPIGNMMHKDENNQLHITIDMPLGEPLPDIDIAGSGGLGISVSGWSNINTDIPIL